MLKYILTYYCLLLSICTIAQIEKIETDRPGQTNTPSTTPNKWLQTEIGFQKQTYRFQPVLKDLYFQMPSLLTKYGIGNRLEVRLITEFAYLKLGNANGTFIDKGLNNAQIGGKFNFLKEKGIIPKMSIIAHYRLNTLNTISVGRDTINGGNIRFAMLHSISENFNLGYNFGLDMRAWDYDPMYLYTFSPKFNIAEKWQAFVEIYGYFWKGRIPQTSIDGGLCYFINDNFKIDAAAGTRINKNTKLKFYSIGTSFRFKTSKNN
jgi:Putative MetA-pathway of phenol degradation